MNIDVRASVFAIAILVTLVCPVQAFADSVTPPPVVSRAISIGEAVAIAFENSPRIAGQQSEANAGKARIGMVKAMTRPQLSTTTFLTTGTMPNIVSGAPSVQPMGSLLVPDKGQADQNLTAMLPLYTGGRLQGQVRGAQKEYEASQSDVKTIRLDVALEVKTAYKKTLLARSFVETYKRREDESRERVRIAEAAFTEGKIAKFDLLRNLTELADSQQTLNNSLKDVDLALVDLKATLGISQASELTLTDVLSAQPLTVNISEVEAAALRTRPEMVSAKLRVQAAQAAVDSAKSAYRPQVYAVGMQDFASTSSAGFDQGYTVGLTAAIPLVDGGQRKSVVNEARAMLEKTRAEERATMIQVSREAATAFTEAQAAAQNLSLAQAAIDQAHEDYRVIKLRYDSGKSINIEVLDALASLTKARTNLAQAQYESSAAQDRLERAEGSIKGGSPE